MTETAKVIEGVHFDFTGEELSKLMRDRAAYHEGRARTKEGELPPLRELMERIKANPDAAAAQALGKMSSSYKTEDPVKDLETDIRRHQSWALKFRVYADHFIPTATYRLGEGDLTRLELVPS